MILPQLSFKLIFAFLSARPSGAALAQMVPIIQPTVFFHVHGGDCHVGIVNDVLCLTVIIPRE